MVEKYNQKKENKKKTSKKKDYICEYTDCICKKAKCEGIDVALVDCDDCPVFESVAIGDQW